VAPVPAPVVVNRPPAALAPLTLRTPRGRPVPMPVTIAATASGATPRRLGPQPLRRSSRLQARGGLGL
jgi:hypothetical protein